MSDELINTIDPTKYQCHVCNAWIIEEEGEWEKAITTNPIPSYNLWCLECWNYMSSEIKKVKDVRKRK